MVHHRLPNCAVPLGRGRGQGTPPASEDTQRSGVPQRALEADGPARGPAPGPRPARHRASVPGSYGAPTMTSRVNVGNAWPRLVKLKRIG